MRSAGPETVTTAAPTIVPGHKRPGADHRLWVSLAASAFTHGLALAVFAGLLLPAAAPVWIRLGEPAVVQVLLAGPEPAATALQPEKPVEIAEPRHAIEPIATPLPAPPQPLAERPAPVRRTDTRPAAAPSTGAATPTEPSPDAVAEDVPIPPGDVAVGAAENADPLGRTQALRLAQRFAQPIARPPRLQDPLTVPYPVRAARGHREARIAALLIIDSNGKVLETTLVPDDPLFTATVQDALATAKFKPAETDAKPTSYWLILEFVFTMRPALSPQLPGPR
jgi:Gram-negative bacterial TonB protein C-terminal